MKNPEKIEATYHSVIKNLSHSIPDGIIKIDLDFLESASLISSHTNQQAQAPSSDPIAPNPDSREKPAEPKKTLQFHIMESEEKVTLFNDNFAVWILPTTQNNQTSTIVIIGRYSDKNNNEESPNITLGFSTSGMYNTSKIILKIVEHFINDIVTTEKELSEIKI
ncbi:MAG: hypothetical protein KAH32_04980 [Chlamydiia bacterium]|nr:hypothetical protein [Chlamydiia bacterium]